MIKTVAALAGALAIASPSFAQPKEPTAAVRSDAETKQREIDTNLALLKTLEERRAAVAASRDQSEESRRGALTFLDSRIALLRVRLEASERR